MWADLWASSCSKLTLHCFWFLSSRCRCHLIFKIMIIGQSHLVTLIWRGEWGFQRLCRLCMITQLIGVRLRSPALELIEQFCYYLQCCALNRNKWPHLPQLVNQLSWVPSQWCRPGTKSMTQPDSFSRAGFQQSHSLQSKGLAPQVQEQKASTELLSCSKETSCHS